MRIAMEVIQLIDVDAVAFIGDYVEQKAFLMRATLN